MKVNSINNRDISFNGFWNSKALKKTLEFAEKNGALFTSATSFAFSLGVRPLSIWLTPKTDKENKKVAMAKSLASTATEVAMTYIISKPIVGAIANIDKNPQKYLKKETIKFLKENSKELTESKAYALATQMFKLGLGIAIAAPKAILTAIGMPYVLDLIFNKKSVEIDSKKDLVFKGKTSEFFAKHIGKAIDNNGFQNFAKKNKDSNFPMHIVALRDVIATSAFVGQTAKSKKLPDERKEPIIFNSIISTTLSILSTYLVDKLLEPLGEDIIKKIKINNKNDIKLDKYIKGFKIAKPAIIAAIIYYTIIPFVSTFFADRVSIKK